MILMLKIFKLRKPKQKVEIKFKVVAIKKKLVFNMFGFQSITEKMSKYQSHSYVIILEIKCTLKVKFMWRNIKEW